MSDEIKRLLDGALPTAPPPSVMDSDSAVASGRRALGRRRYAAGGGVLTGVAAVAVAVTMLMNTAGGSGGFPGADAAGDPSASASDRAEDLPEPEYGTQPVVSPPQLDAGESYYWERMRDGTITGNTNAYSEAFLHYLETFQPGFRDVTAEHWAGVDYTSDGGGNPEGTQSAFYREDVSLVQPDLSTDDDDMIAMGYTQPVYALWFWPDDAGEPLSSTFLRFPDSAGDAEIIDVRVLPAGGFTDGTDGTAHENDPRGDEGFYDLVQCADYRDEPGASASYDVDVTCTNAEGPNGERVIEVREVRTPVVEDPYTWQEVVNTLVMFRADGTAVEVVDKPYNESIEEPGQTLEPALDFTEMLDLAAALPAALVE